MKRQWIISLAVLTATFVPSLPVVAEKLVIEFLFALLGHYC